MDSAREATAAARRTRGTPLARPAGSYLTFRLGEQSFAIDSQHVQEIRSYEPPTCIANAPQAIQGVVNLRGVIVPIVDLRLMFDHMTADCSGLKVVMVLNLRGRVIGAVVDAISEVLELAADSVAPVAPRAAAAALSCVSGNTGIGVAGDRPLVILDIDTLMSRADLGLAQAGH